MSDASDEYVAGDVNTIDDGPEDDFDDMDDVGNDVDDVNDVDDAGHADKAAAAIAALEFIAKSLAEDPEAVSVEVSERQGKVILSLSVGPSDMGRVIGRRGRTAQAIRALVGAVGSRDGVTTSVDIVD
jgi:predicted RNA-binding protein YlqC (UPF0109 family)